MRCLRCGTENPDNANNCAKCATALRRICPRCKAINHQKQVFCGNCGLKLINVCPRCKAHNSPVQRHCGNCGLKIVNFCTKCGMNNPINQRFCGNCATRLLPGQPTRPAQPPKPIEHTMPPGKPTREESLPQKPAPTVSSAPQTLPPRVQPPVRQKIQPYPPEQGQPYPQQPRTASEMGRLLRAQQSTVSQQQAPVKQVVQQSPPVTEMPTMQKPEQQVKEAIIRQEPRPVEVTPIQAQAQVQIPVAPVETQELQIDTQVPEIQESQQISIANISTEEITVTQPETLIPSITEDKPPVEEHEVVSQVETRAEPVKPQPDQQEVEFVEHLGQSYKPTDELITQTIQQEEAELQAQQTIYTEEDQNIVEEEEEVEDFLREIEESLDDITEPASLKQFVRFAVLSVEMFNFSNLAEKLEKTTLTNLKNKVWTSVKNIASNNGEEFIEFSDSIGVISFTHAETKQQSSISAISVAKEVLKLVNILNKQLMSSMNIEVKIKIGIAFNDAKGVSDLERSLAAGGSIVVSEEIKQDTEGICNYLTIGPLPLGNQMVTFFKYVPTEEEESSFIEDIPISKEAPSQKTISKKTEYEKKTKPSEGLPTSPPRVEDKEPIPVLETKNLTRDAILSNLMNVCHLITSSGKGEFCSLIAEDGYGKTSIIKTLKSSLSPQSFTWLIARCDSQQQLMPLGAIRSMLRNYLGLPDIVYNREEARAIIKSAVETTVGSNDQLCYLLNSLILGDEVSGLNKNYIVNAIFTLVKAISEKTTVIMVIEDLDTIDNTSFEILDILIENKVLDLKVLIIATFHPKLNFVESKPHLIKMIKYSQMALKPLELESIDKSIQDIIQSPLVLPDILKQQVNNVSNGAPFVIENALLLMYELGVIVNAGDGPAFNPEASQWELPATLQDILLLRLHRFSQVNPNAFILLQLATVLGPKFSPVMLQDISQTGKHFDENLQALITSNLLLQEDPQTITFKHHILWEIMYYAGITNENRPQYHMQVLNYLERIQQAGGRMDLAYLAYQAELAGKRRKALNYWNLVANQVLTLGLNTGYSETMMRYINILEESDIPNKKDLQISALEGIAKSVYVTDPELATQAFSKVIPLREQEQNIPALIELRGYLCLSLEHLGRWDESVVHINKSLAFVKAETMPLERAVLLASQLNSMESMGKIAWITRTCSKEIFPALDNALKNKQIPEGMTEEQLFRVYCNAKISFANALIALGHGQCFAVFGEIMPEIERRGIQDLALKSYLLNAKGHAIRGEIKSCEQMLLQSREYLAQIPGINNFSLLWHEAACYMNLELGNWEVLSGLLDVLRIHAKKMNSYPVIALTKSCQGLLAQIEGKPKESLETFNDLINYASQYKLTTFALIGWYYIAASEIQSRNYDKAESIIKRAIDVAKMPDVYNINSLVSLNRLLGELYIRKGDIESSGAPLEEAWKNATELQNHSQVAKVAVTIGQMYQELIGKTEDSKQEYAEKAYEFFSNSLNIFNQLGNPYQIKRVEKALENLKFVCKVNSVNI